MKEPKFYLCKHCGNIITKLRDGGVNVVCCGEEMHLLEVNTTDGAHEKHVPFLYQKDDYLKVQVGEVSHPMTEKHFIEWVYVYTANGGQIKYFKPDDEPIAEFKIINDEILAVYEHCNIHGLYKKAVKE